MWILTINGREDEGAYSVVNEYGDHVLYIFEEEDDAVRFSLMLESLNHPEMHVIEVDKKLIIRTCEYYQYNYAIITKDDLVIPPEEYDNI
jgi:hypothetical protein